MMMCKNINWCQMEKMRGTRFSTTLKEDTRSCCTYCGVLVWYLHHGKASKISTVVISSACSLTHTPSYL